MNNIKRQSNPKLNTTNKIPTPKLSSQITTPKVITNPNQPTQNQDKRSRNGSHTKGALSNAETMFNQYKTSISNINTLNNSKKNTNNRRASKDKDNTNIEIKRSHKQLKHKSIDITSSFIVKSKNQNLLDNEEEAQKSLIDYIKYFNTKLDTEVSEVLDSKKAPVIHDLITNKVDKIDKTKINNKINNETKQNKNYSLNNSKSLFLNNKSSNIKANITVKENYIKKDNQDKQDSQKQVPVVVNNKQDNNQDHEPFKKLSITTIKSDNSNSSNTNYNPDNRQRHLSPISNKDLNSQQTSSINSITKNLQDSINKFKNYNIHVSKISSASEGKGSTYDGNFTPKETVEKNSIFDDFLTKKDSNSHKQSQHSQMLNSQNSLMASDTSRKLEVI